MAPSDWEVKRARPNLPTMLAKKVVLSWSLTGVDAQWMKVLSLGCWGWQVDSLPINGTLSMFPGPGDAGDVIKG
jgi:hypothetical protein